MIQGVRQQTFPVDLREPTDDWAKDLRTRHGEALQEARIDLCVPLRGAGRLVGILT